MPLEQLSFSPKPGQIPAGVTAMIAEAGQRCDAFFDAGLDRRYPRYLPSNPEKVYAAIATLKDSGLLRGNVFCEWGSGFGIATCMASLIGFEAFGIEVEDGLVELSTQLAQDLNIPVEILCTSYLPEGYEECEGIGGKDLLPPRATTSGGANIDITPVYDGLDPDDVDLFFVYPWPGQEEFMMDLFDEVASEDAILLIYHADASTTTYRRSFDG
ncbi:hypothetical protein N9C66_02930 [Akkermansiaceae bacterium]|nr:hypothetical protein [Akkermansiaceae bacterium]MDF1710629.1 hypothetical protein [Akkermansiaceae bacterium]